ncbi:MAG: hypothetical protein H7327_15485 [Herminiimonas sp.]|nr:hypothetical protein [Herminiimonas sp.]
MMPQLIAYAHRLRSVPGLTEKPGDVLAGAGFEDGARSEAAGIALQPSSNTAVSAISAAMVSEPVVDMIASSPGGFLSSSAD